MGIPSLHRDFVRRASCSNYSYLGSVNPRLKAPDLDMEEDVLRVAIARCHVAAT